MKACRACAGALELLLDLGDQPVCHRFLRGDEPDEKFPFSLSVCGRCGLLQLVDPPPADALAPVYDWVSYIEPEAHLDEAATLLADAAGAGALAVGATYKDDSLLERLSRRGLRAARVDPRVDLGIMDAKAGLETVQQRLDSATAAAAATRLGRADLVVARHLLEHGHDTRRLVCALTALVKPGGRLYLEIPDTSQALVSGDYTTLWEEHVLYFTPETFRRALGSWGLAEQSFLTFPYSLEDCLAAVVTPSTEVAPAPPSPDERESAARFARDFPAWRTRTRAALKHRRQQGPVALLGAGHRACLYLNIVGADERVDFVVDDHPAKRGLRMPGSTLPILSGSALVERDVRLCLLGVNPDAERRVLEKNRAFLERGGAFASIYPGSRLAFDRQGTPA